MQHLLELSSERMCQHSCQVLKLLRAWLTSLIKNSCCYATHVTSGAVHFTQYWACSVAFFVFSLDQSASITTAVHRCRRFFAAAVSKIDLAALLRSSAAAVQLAALRAGNTLSQHMEMLPNNAVPFIVKQLQNRDGKLGKHPSPASLLAEFDFFLFSQGR